MRSTSRLNEDPADILGRANNCFRMLYIWAIIATVVMDRHVIKMPIKQLLHSSFVDDNGHTSTWVPGISCIVLDSPRGWGRWE